MQKCLIGLIGVTVLFFGFIVVRIGVAKPADSVKVAKIEAGQELNMNAYSKAYPLQYKSYMKNNEMAPSVTGFGGSTKYQHSERQPEIKENFKGYPFSIDYADDRGHTYAGEDVLSTKRINDKSPAACITCKTPYVDKFYQEMGWKYASRPFKELANQVPADGYLSCAECHEPQTMALRVVNPAFIEALARQGKDIKNATHQEMRAYVCAQCHVEYYFDKDKRVVLPWDKGVKPADMYAYYSEHDKTDFESDFVQPDSKVKVLKAQHPDYETWSTSVHADNGVTCVDCHMPYMRDNGQKYTSHWMTDPLRTPEDSCGKCHQDTAKLTERVKTIQNNTFQIQHTAGQTVAKAHQAIKAASEQPGVDLVELENARELTRKAQWFWDIVAAENSMGFHNPDQALNTLGQSIDLAHQAIESANKAAKGSII
ncbi:MAG: Nitrite reductase (cytochrome, ammonia-forming) [Firmicutes bacterium]|nr:Nitrite reductase (cytochrome, ammonia-forming) [Bacillota bacterium]